MRSYTYKLLLKFWTVISAIICATSPTFGTTLELRTAPLALLAQWTTLDTSYNLNDHWATGPALVVYSGPEYAF